VATTSFTTGVVLAHTTTSPNDEREAAQQITGADLRSRALWFPWSTDLRLRRQLSSQPLAAQKSLLHANPISICETAKLVGGSRNTPHLVLGLRGSGFGHAPGVYLAIWPWRHSAVCGDHSLRWTHCAVYHVRGLFSLGGGDYGLRGSFYSSHRLICSPVDAKLFIMDLNAANPF
jgi:hypothetical protein